MELGPVAYTTMAMTDLTGIQNLSTYYSLDELGLLRDSCPDQYLSRFVLDIHVNLLCST
jgi:hypothetical protein